MKTMILNVIVILFGIANAVKWDKKVMILDEKNFN